MTDKFVMDRVDKRNSKGSSFDAYESNASQMKVNERWKIYKDTEVYRMLFNREIRELSSEIFAFAPI